MKPEAAPLRTTDEDDDLDAIDVRLPKLSSFDPMADAPEVFRVVAEKLWDSILDVEIPGGEEKKIRYRDLYQTVLDEGILTSDVGLMKEVTTKKGRYRSAGWGVEPNLWLLFCLECYFQVKRGHPDEHAGGFARASWLLYETDSFRGDPLGDHEGFFVAVDGEIIVDRFTLSGEVMGPSGSMSLVDTGIWEQTFPPSSGEDTSQYWVNNRAWWIGGLRALYAKFYDGTAAGRVCALAPGNPRLDELRFWVSTPAPDPALKVMSRRVGVIAERVDWMAGWLKIALFLGLAVAIAVVVRDFLR